jgi:hypothetical protein
MSQPRDPDQVDGRAALGSPAERGSIDPITALKRFYAIGRKSLDKYPGGVGYGGMDEEAARHGLSAELLRKARSLADVYTREDLDAACELADQKGFPLGVSHVIRLLTVEKSARTRLQKKMIEQGWSKRQLDAEIRKRFGNRNPTAGRRPPTPETAEDAYYAITRLCEQWERLMAALDGKGKGAEGTGEIRVAPDLPPAVCKKLGRATEALRDLNNVIAEQVERE